MHWTVRTRLVGLSALGLTLLFAVGATGWWSLRQANRTSAALQTSVQTVRDHLEMDMMHDAIRADVLVVTSARTPHERHQGAEALREHIARLERYSEKLGALALDVETRAVLGEMRGEFHGYAALATRIAQRGEQGDAAGAESLLPEFLAKWRELEPVAERVSDRLEATGATAAGAMDHAAGT